MEQSNPLASPIAKSPDIASCDKTEQPIRGADAIAEFIFGDRCHRRKVYYLAECSKVPIYRLGATLCLRPSVYRNWIAQQEARSIANMHQQSS